MNGGMTRALAHGAWPEAAAAQASLKPFAPVLTGFVAELSRQLLGNPGVRRHPELVALGYWMRPASVRRIVDRFLSRLDHAVAAPRGLVFHIAPSNVDTIFVYSWVLSLLCGNRNVVRLSSRSTPQLELLLQTIDACLALEAYADVASRISVVRYEHADSITGALSARADTRVIWGGDQTVQAIRRIPLPPTANEVAFANKLSLAVLDGMHWKGLDDAARDALAQRFANDAYWFAQAACSSPRALLWHGSLPPPADVDDFWRRVLRASDAIPGDFLAVDAVNKLVSADQVAAELEASFLPTPDNRLTRVGIRIDQLASVLDRDVHCGAGLFFEASLPRLADLVPALSRRVQTLSHAGLEPAALVEFLSSGPLPGIDRAVPFGQALDFSPVWDGFDFFEVLTRRVTWA